MKILMRLLGVGVAGAMLSAVGAFFMMDFKIGSSQKTAKEAAGVAMQVISFTQEVQEVFGTPLTMGEATVQREESAFLGSASMTLRIPLAGPDSTGHATVNLVRKSAKAPWKVTNGNVFPASGRPVFLRGR